MNWDIVVTFGALLGVLLVLVFELVSADIALMGALAVVVLAGVCTVEEALVGFANPTLLALASLYIVAAALRNTGGLTVAARYLFGGAQGMRRLIARVIAPVSVASAFLNNTPIVAMAIPAIQGWCKEHEVSPTRLLLPLSYASIFGGMCTLMGTSTNLVAHGLLQSNGMEGLGFFELAFVGIPCTIVGWIYLVVVTPWLLEERPLVEEEQELASPEQEVVEIEIVEEAEAVGRELGDAGLRSPPGLRLNRIERDGASIAPVEEDTRICAGDRLYYVVGADASTVDPDGYPGLKLEVSDIQQLEDVEGDELESHSVVVRDGSRLVGETVSGSGLQQRYNAVVNQVRRGGDALDEVADATLKAGDTLRLTTGPDFRSAFQDSEEFYVTSRYREDESTTQAMSGRERLEMWGSLAVLVAVVAFSAAGWLHIAVWALLGAVLLVVTGVVPAMRARDAIDWKVLVVIGAALGLGEAMEASGAAKQVGDVVVAIGQQGGSFGLLVAVIVGTSILTNLITNNGAVALFFPIVLSVSDAVEMEVRPLVIGITVAGSMALATPLGYQTNLMVYSAGDYRFVDFVKLGIPLQLVLTSVAAAVIPVFWLF